VATEQQFAANRRNARRSTGPRSSAGKKRASRNSYRHGLTARLTGGTQRSQDIEALARKIVGQSTDPIILENARTVARAEFDLAGIRSVKVALISRVMAFGQIETPRDFESLGQVKRCLNAIARGEVMLPEPAQTEAAMPITEPERTAETVRRALPELIKLDRYERRATAQRDRSMRAIFGRVKRI
jgi:hypothetical protein